MDTMEPATRKKVRQHPAALRQQVLMECARPGASVARVVRAARAFLKAISDKRVEAVIGN